MNGGVSLAVWIGGVTQEVDCIRRARSSVGSDSPKSTTALYHRLLEILRERVVVDVISGASAGGINGALLGAAIYAETPLPQLRDVWITVGDFTRLLRSPSVREPPSLLRGDDFVLAELERRTAQILHGAHQGPPNQRLYLYITATDYYGVPKVFEDSTHRRFQEREHRRIFRFQHPAPGPPGEDERAAIAKAQAETAARGRGPGTMPAVAGFRRADGPELLARAARSSSSFPVAFEAHGLDVESEDVPRDELHRWLIDGGVLDNQPFNPVLNRIGTISAGDVPVRRVLGYVVPYVTEPSDVLAEPQHEGAAPDPQPTARDTASAASSLPRDLPRLTSLERVMRELADGRKAEAARTRFAMLDASGDLASAAKSLFSAYRETRLAECLETLAHWALPTFKPGAGEIGQLETLDPRQALEGPADVQQLSPAEAAKPRPWLPQRREWKPRADWTWGLSPSERIATEALVALRERLFADPQNQELRASKEHAANLVEDIRAKKFLLCVEFRGLSDGSDVERADQVYLKHVGELTTEFESLDRNLKAAGGPPLQSLIDAEIVQNALGTDLSGESRSASTSFT